MDPAVVIVIFVLVAIVIRLLAGSMDGDRVRAYIEERGGRLLSSGWAPFGKGWLGEKSDRIYEVRYLDSDGNEHEASCKTSMFTGVYFTEDCIVRHAKPPTEAQHASPVTEIERENRRLRDELERLKGRHD